MTKRLLVLLFGLLSFLLIRTTAFSQASLDTSNDGQNVVPAIILFIGDGMGSFHRQAAQWYSVGQSGELVMDTLDYSGLSKTASANNLITDSAASATAIATGNKTNNGMISVSPTNQPLTTILETAQEIGLSVGLVTTVQMSHATPAAFAAHVESRTMMNEIAEQIISHRVNILFGGGESYFLPTTSSGCYPNPGVRGDGKNLITQAQNNGYTYVCTEDELDLIIPENEHLVLGLFADEAMTRPFSPSLEKMTGTAIEILSQDPDGFFLMVESGQIDVAAHQNDALNVIGDTLALDRAVTVALSYAAKNPKALVIVTADHETGGLSLSLNPTGSPSEDGPFYMPDGTPFYVNWSTTYHTGVDVPTTAQGYLAHHFIGTYENTHTYTVMNDALYWTVLLPLLITK